MLKCREKNVLAMRMGPGKHLYGRKLLDGAVEPEDFDCFHDQIVAQETGYISARGFMDGMFQETIGETIF